MITFVNFTLSKSTSKANYSWTAMEVQRQYKDGSAPFHWLIRFFCSVIFIFFLQFLLNMY